MKKTILILFSTLIFANAFASDKELLFMIRRPSNAGQFSLGMRSTASVFNDGSWRNFGMGVGGQFRIRFSDNVNTQWFFDYVNGTVGDFASRVDYHIGWNVMLYPQKNMQDNKYKFNPYFIAGHCFDYTNVKDKTDENNYAERWSSAVQAGLGVHYNLTQKFDISFETQYMIHLGTDIHAEKENGIVHIEKEKGVNLEGHVLMNLSLNYKIGKLWVR